MPYKSEAQRRYMWAVHPDIARRWADEGKGNVVKRKSNGHKSSSRKSSSSRGRRR